MYSFLKFNCAAVKKVRNGKLVQPTLHWTRDYLSMLGLKLIDVNNGAHGKNCWRRLGTWTSGRTNDLFFDDLRHHGAHATSIQWNVNPNSYSYHFMPQLILIKTNSTEQDNWSPASGCHRISFVYFRWRPPAFRVCIGIYCCCTLFSYINNIKSQQLLQFVIFGHSYDDLYTLALTVVAPFFRIYRI